MDTPATTPPRAPADHPVPRHIAMILRPLYSRIVRVRSLPDAPADAPAAPAEGPAFQILDTAEVFDAIDGTAREEPTTVAEARALIADPQAALAESELERQIAWLVAGADLRHRRAGAARFGGIVA